MVLAYETRLDRAGGGAGAGRMPSVKTDRAEMEAVQQQEEYEESRESRKV